MKLFLSAGEPSGDLHGANLIRELKTRMPQASFCGFGGKKMVEAGLDLHYPLTDLAVMWFGRVLLNFRTFTGLLNRAEELETGLCQNLQRIGDQMIDISKDEAADLRIYARTLDNLTQSYKKPHA